MTNQITGTPFNIIEPPVTLKLLPLNKIARDLALKDIPAALKHYNKLDPETQKDLNERCVLLSRNTPIGGPPGISFIQLLGGAARGQALFGFFNHTYFCVKPENQIPVLQQALGVTLSVSSAETTESVGTDPYFDTLPTEVVFQILREANAPPKICSFFQECQSGILSWEHRQPLHELYRNFQEDLKQLNSAWGGTLTALIAELPHTSEIKRKEDLQAVADKTIAELSKYLPGHSEKELRELYGWHCTHHLSTHWMQGTLTVLIFGLCQLLDSTQLSSKQHIEKLVLHLLEKGWSEPAYHACLQSPSIRALGQGDVYAGLSELIKQLICSPMSYKGVKLVLQLVDHAPEQIKFRILAPCTQQLLQAGCRELVFDIACAIPNIVERDAEFPQIILWLTYHGYSESDLILRIIEKLGEKDANCCLQLMIKGLLKEKKGEKALLMAPRLTPSNEYGKHLCFQIWRDLIDFFIEANDPHQAFALLDQLDITNLMSCSILSKLALLLVKHNEYEKASSVTNKIVENFEKGYSMAHLRDVAKALAEKGNWDEVMDVTLQLINEQEFTYVREIIHVLVKEYDQVEVATFLAKKVAQDGFIEESGRMQMLIAGSLIQQKRWEEVIAFASEIESDLYREYVFDRISTERN